MKEITKSGKTVDEAVNAAISELNITKEDVKFHVIEEPKKGFMGMGSKPAIVQVMENTDPIKVARSFLQSVTEKMGVHTKIEAEIAGEGDPVLLQLSAEKAAILIGKHGNTLNALQYLTNLTVNRHRDEHVHMILDVENYRAKREDTLKQLALRLSGKVENTGREVKLEPMPSMERKVIHVTLKDRDKVSTYSDGEDPYRRVVITPERNNK